MCASMDVVCFGSEREGALVPVQWMCVEAGKGVPHALSGCVRFAFQQMSIVKAVQGRDLLVGHDDIAVEGIVHEQRLAESA